MKTTYINSVRVAFNFKVWNPNQSEWTFAASCIQPEEKERIERFVFKKDAKAAMVGRLLIRKVLAEKLKLAYNTIQLARTSKGRPYLATALPPMVSKFDFNIAHHGDFAVIAADAEIQIGVDVMKIEVPNGKSIPDFLKHMERQFSELEWRVIRSQPAEKEQIQMFCRHWCLKESLVKAMGEGLGFGMQRMEFYIKTAKLTSEHVITDTQVKIDGKPDAHWKFEESLLHNHCVTVAVRKTDSDTCPGESDIQVLNGSGVVYNSSEDKVFRVVSLGEILSGAVPLSEVVDQQYWPKFESKPEGPKERRR